MTKMNINIQEIREMSTLPQLIEADKIEAESRVLEARTKAKIQTAMLEGIIPDENTAQKRREIARMRASNELLEEKLKRAELLRAAQKAGLIETDSEPHDA